MGAWGMLEAHGILPMPGARFDQNPKFLAAAEIASGERARVEAELVRPKGKSDDGPLPSQQPARRGGVGEDGVVRGGFKAPGEG